MKISKPILGAVMILALSSSVMCGEAIAAPNLSSVIPKQSILERAKNYLSGTKAQWERCWGNQVERYTESIFGHKWDKTTVLKVCSNEEICVTPVGDIKTPSGKPECIKPDFIDETIDCAGLNAKKIKAGVFGMIVVLDQHCPQDKPHCAFGQCVDDSKLTCFDSDGDRGEAQIQSVVAGGAIKNLVKVDGTVEEDVQYDNCKNTRFLNEVFCGDDLQIHTNGVDCATFNSAVKCKEVGESAKCEYDLPLKVASGNWSVCALTIDGDVRCTVDSHLPMYSETPPSIGIFSEIKALSMASERGCVVTKMGQVKCWQENYSFPTLEQLEMIEGLSAAADVSVGGSHTCVIESDGGLKCFGKNDKGQLGNGTTVDLAVPAVAILNGVKKVAAGGSHTCALMQAGNIKCWGDNSNGQLGDGTTADKLVPVDVIGLSQVNDISTGTNHSCALLANKKVKCWGTRTVEVGPEEATSFTPFKNVSDFQPVEMSGLTNADSILSNGDLTCAVAAGEVYCWGRRLSDLSLSGKYVPTKIDGLSNIRSFSLGRLSCALTDTGKVLCHEVMLSGLSWLGSSYHEVKLE